MGTYAQSKLNSTIPDPVISALNQKYPGAELERWRTKKDVFTAKIRLDGKKYFAAFDEKGNWINTSSKISWPWGLPKNIRIAYKKSDYGPWNLFVSKKIESPAGDFYELMVDNSELNRTNPPEYIIPSTKLLKFKANGELAGVTDISENPVLKF